MLVKRRLTHPTLHLRLVQPKLLDYGQTGGNPLSQAQKKLSAQYLDADSGGIFSADGVQPVHRLFTALSRGFPARPGLFSCKLVAEILSAFEP